MGDIRVIKPAVGGGFGAKAEATPLEFCSAILARLTGRPVRMEYTREEMFRHFRGRHKQSIDLKIGDPAPAFALPGSDGKVYKLSDYKGKVVVLAWFPKAFTGG